MEGVKAEGWWERAAERRDKELVNLLSASLPRGYRVHLFLLTY